jgi:hypothetical protein
MAVLLAPMLLRLHFHMMAEPSPYHCHHQLVPILLLKVAVKPLKISTLWNYPKAKRLCYVCGDRWWKDHVCKPAVQLHFVQELIDHLQSGAPKPAVIVKSQN